MCVCVADLQREEGLLQAQHLLQERDLYNI